MKYVYEGVTYELSFKHSVVEHERFKEPRLATTLTVTGPSGAVHAQSQVLFNPKGKVKTFSKELMRQAAIDEIGWERSMLPGEYDLLRRAYFLRKRLKRAERGQRRAFHRELRKIIADGDCGPALRSGAELVLRMSLLRFGHAEAKELSI